MSFARIVILSIVLTSGVEGCNSASNVRKVTEGELVLEGVSIVDVVRIYYNGPKPVRILPEVATNLITLSVPRFSKEMAQLREVLQGNDLELTETETGFTVGRRR